MDSLRIDAKISVRVEHQQKLTQILLLNFIILENLYKMRTKIFQKFSEIFNKINKIFKIFKNFYFL